MNNLPAFKIVKRDFTGDYDCCTRQYRNCVINTLINLHSKNIFEIGSFTFQTSAAISYYLDKYMPEGKLVTADITTWNRGEAPPRVHPVMFYPYDEDPSLEHGQMQMYYSNYKEVARKELALELNAAKLFDKMTELLISKFCLTFVDGSHSRNSFLKDMELAQLFTRNDGWILIDDIYPTPGGETYEQHEVYQQLKRHNEFYEYEDWSPQPVFSLIQNSKLVMK